MYLRRLGIIPYTQFPNFPKKPARCSHTNQRLALLLTSCDFRLKSEREVEKYLEKQYGQEFTVLSSESVTDDYYYAFPSTRDSAVIAIKTDTS